MFFRILGKDIKRKKGINIIIFLFMIMATVFVASSVNNILVVSNATQYCMDKGKVGKIYIAAYETKNQNEVADYLKKENISYSKNESLMVSLSNIKEFAGKDGEEYNFTGIICLQKSWHDNMLIFDQSGEMLNVKDGELAMQQRDMDRNNLKIGDSIVLGFGNKEKTFKIAAPLQDPALGGDFIGMTRYLISDNDYDELSSGVSTLLSHYNINPENVDSFTKKFNSQGLSTVVTLEQEMFKFAYVMSTITAGILIIVGVCLIIISFLILRFTIVFTIREDYKEIGIMKAIGLRDISIKKLYLIKYFVLVFAAVVIGGALSVPVSSLMLDTVAHNMMMQKGDANLLVNVLCSVAVMVIVLAFCYFCTNKLRKISAIEAIRGGQDGKRFKKRIVSSLHSHKKISPILFLAFNDIASNIKRYVVLILTFMIGTVLIILPLNTLNTMTGDEMAKNFVLDPTADFFVSKDTSEMDVNESMTKNGQIKNMKSMQNEFRKKGYETKIDTLSFYTISYYKDNPDEVDQIMALKPIKSDGSFVELIEGKTPILDNEIAFTENAMKKMDLHIGDHIKLRMGDGVKDMVIVASYQNYMQMGESAFLSERMELNSTMSAVWIYQVRTTNIEDKTDLVEQVKKDFPTYKIMNSREAMDEQLGNTLSQLGFIKMVILLVICGVYVLITVLMLKIFILGEKSQIAMLRSLGFSVRAVRLWQCLRIGITLLISILLGILVSTPLNTLLLKPVFGMMGGTHIKIQADILEGYIIYPLILFIITTIVAYISTRSIRKMNLMEINNVE